MSRSDYVARVQRVQDYIEQHLTEPLTLPELAKVAYFSPFHFHRIFASVVGETPSAFVRRLRLEKAASMLQTHPEHSITAIALDCGWQEASSFSRAFRRQFGIAANEWRKKCQVDRNLGQADGTPRTVSSLHKENLMSQSPLSPLSADVADREALTVAYVRHTGPYAGDGALFQRLFGQLMGWLGAHNLMGPNTRMFAIYHDDPNITSEDQLRVSVCGSVPADTKAEGDVGILKLQAGRSLVAEFRLTSDQFPAAWQWAYGEWLPQSAYEPDDRLPYEEYLGQPDEQGVHHVALVVPVRPRTTS